MESYNPNTFSAKSFAQNEFYFNYILDTQSGYKRKTAKFHSFFDSGNCTKITQESDFKVFFSKKHFNFFIVRYMNGFWLPGMVGLRKTEKLVFLCLFRVWGRADSDFCCEECSDYEVYCKWFVVVFWGF